MNDANNQRPTVRRRLFAWARRVFTALAVIAVCMVIVYLIVNAAYARSAARARAEFAERFGASSYEAFLKQPADPEHDAARVYRYAAAEFERAASGYEENVIYDVHDAQTVPAADAPIRGLLADAQSALDAVVAITETPGAVFRTAYDPDYNNSALLSEGKDLRSVTRFLTARAIVRAYDGDADGAFRDVGAALHVTNDLTDSPSLMSGLTQRAMAELVFGTMRTVLHVIPAYPADDSALREELARLRDPSVPIRMIAGEAIWSNDVLQRTVPLELPTHTIAIKWSQYAAALDEAQQRPDHAGREAARAAAQAEAMEGSFSLHWAFHLIAPMIPDNLTAYDMIAVECDQLDVALALCRYRLDNGQYPEALDALIPRYLDALPLDWYTGQPMRYERQDEGYVLYSLGPDGEDDGGVALKKGPGPKNGDITWQTGLPAMDAAEQSSRRGADQ